MDGLSEQVVSAAMACVVEPSPGQYSYQPERFADLRKVLEASAPRDDFPMVVRDLCTLAIFMRTKPELEPLARPLLSMVDEVAAPVAEKLRGQQVKIAAERVNAVGNRFTHFMGSATGGESVPDSGARLAGAQLPKTFRG